MSFDVQTTAWGTTLLIVRRSAAVLGSRCGSSLVSEAQQSGQVCPWTLLLSIDPCACLPPQDGSDVLQFQRFRVFHPLPKQAHHGILKTLWDKRVQWNQGLNARRTKQLLQVSTDTCAVRLHASWERPAIVCARQWRAWSKHAGQGAVLVALLCCMPAET